MKIFLLFMAFLFLGEMSFAQSSGEAVSSQEKLLDFPFDPPKQVMSGSIFKKFFRYKIFDIDKALKESGVQIVACSYKNRKTGRVTNYRALSYCVFDHFWDSMSYNNNVGLTFFWIRDKNAKMIPIRLDWQPTAEGWKGTLKEWLILTKDMLSSSRSKSEDENSIESVENSQPDQFEPAPFKHNFIGQFKMSFPSGTRFTDVFFEKNAFTNLLQLDRASQISIEMNPMQIKNKKVQYQGKILISQEALVNPAGDILSIDFKTDVNVFYMKRAFESSAHISTDQNNEELLQ